MANRPKSDGRFKKGERRGRATEFKKGQHWRPHQPHWDKDWLVREYVEKQRSTGEIAAEVGCTDANILFWLRKHKIPRRSVHQARAIKYWGLKGEDNPMHGRRGQMHPGWRGGHTPERAALYNSEEWSRAALAVWKRDKATCQKCGITKRQIGVLHIHHIVSFCVRELRAEVSNLVLLCPPCHKWVHGKKNTQKLFIKEV